MALTVLVVVMACHVACSLRWLVVRRCTPPSGRRLDRTAPTPWGTRAPRGDGRSGWRSPRRCRGHVGTVRTQDHPRFSGPLALRTIGRASCRERVCQYVSTTSVAVYL